MTKMSQKKQINSTLSNFWKNLWMGGRLSGYLRLLMAAVLLAFFVRMGLLVNHDAQNEVRVFSINGLRYLIFPLLALLCALFLSAIYVRDIYELSRVSDGFRYMVACLFSIHHPRLSIRDGKKQLKLDETNLIDRIGGPGYLNIAQGSVALVERLTSPANVYGNGWHYLTRWERLKEIATLDDQHDSIQELSATTKEGVEVIVKQTQFRYRLRAGRAAGDYLRRSPERPYPYTIQGIRNMAYNRFVSINGLTSLEDTVRRSVGITIRNFIQQHQIDYLTAPRAQSNKAREALRGEFSSPPIRNRFGNLGVDVFWIDIGHFAIKDDHVDKERINYWGTKWEGEAEIRRSYGEAKRLALQEKGRAEGQAAMLAEIIHSMNAALASAKTSYDRTQILRNLMMARTAQILDAWAQDGSTKGDINHNTE